MFGYVRPYQPELKIIENQYYKAAYCGLCRAMKKTTGMKSSLTLSYDTTFLVLLRLALTDEIPEFEKKRCFLHPLKKRVVMKSNSALLFAAHAGTLLAWHKINDDISDEKSFKRLFARVLRIFFSSSYKKAKKKYEDLDKIIKDRLCELQNIEKEKIKCADRPALVFGSLMSGILSYGIEADNRALIASSIGMSVGRWIYLIDALDDINEDRKKKSYNPFLLLFDGMELDREKSIDIECAMLAVIKKALDAVDLLDFKGRRDLEGLIQNILCEGLPRKTKSVIFGDRDAKSPENGDNK